MSMKPILFNTEMVQANLEDRKTNTRRLVKPQPDIDGLVRFDDTRFVDTDGRLYKPPYQTGDILYVRETWAQCPDLFGEFPEYIYRADYAENDLRMGDDTTEIYSDFPACVKWRPSIHMPKEAARLFLRVKNVRVERLLTPFFADGAAVLALKKEGVVLPTECVECISNYGTPACVDACDDSECGILDDVRGNFSDIWNSTVKPADLALYGWNANPWVWVIEYERCDKPVEVNSNG